MISSIVNSLDFQGEALKLRANRQQVLAANIVNADTPGFQAVDFDFASALRQKTGGINRASAPGGALVNAQSGTAALNRTNAAHMGVGGAGGAPQLAYRIPAQDSMDKNTVDLDMERAQFAENAIRYEATLRFISNNVKTLQAAMQSTNGG